MGTGMDARAMAVIAQSVRALWFGSLATWKSQTNRVPKIASAWPQRNSDPTNAADREAAKPRYSFKYTNGHQTVEDMRALELSTDRAARREALRTAREMANDVSWQSSQRGAGWTVLVINPMGRQICEVPVRFKKHGLDSRNPSP
jgi:hypothetical protein